jgi:hypothetical protein
VGASHGLAFFSATLASIGAALAVVHVVFPAFLPASAADFSAEPAELFCKLRITRHELSSQNADVGAIPVQPDASFHHLYVVLLQARSRAMFALLSALQARFNTAFVFFVGHISPLLS